MYVCVCTCTTRLQASDSYRLRAMRTKGRPPPLGASAQLPDVHPNFQNKSAERLAYMSIYRQAGEKCKGHDTRSENEDDNTKTPDPLPTSPAAPSFSSVSEANSTPCLYLSPFPPTFSASLFWNPSSVSPDEEIVGTFFTRSRATCLATRAAAAVGRGEAVGVELGVEHGCRKSACVPACCCASPRA